jgi:UDP-N-acetylmuramate-alanine ligase
VREVMARYRGDNEAGIIDLAPRMLLDAGLPYRSSKTAVILDLDHDDLPHHFTEPSRIRRLYSVLADALPHKAYIVIPAGDEELERQAREADVSVATFGMDDSWSADSLHASVEKARIVVRDSGHQLEAKEIDFRWPVQAQLAAALAAHILKREGV